MAINNPPFAQLNLFHLGTPKPNIQGKLYPLMPLRTHLGTPLTSGFVCAPQVENPCFRVVHELGQKSCREGEGLKRLCAMRGVKGGVNVLS